MLWAGTKQPRPCICVAMDMHSARPCCPKTVMHTLVFGIQGWVQAAEWHMVSAPDIEVGDCGFSGGVSQVPNKFRWDTKVL
jgi:hypothetical protein